MARSNVIARSNLKKIIILAVIFAVTAVSLVVAFNWHSVAALYRPTAPAKPIQLNYTNRQHGFSLKFPQYWADSEPNTFGGAPANYIVRFTAPEMEGNAIPVTITIMAKDLPAELAGNETLESYVTKSEAILKETANNYEFISLADSTVSGLPAKILTWSMGDENATLVNDQAIFKKGDTVYIVTMSSLWDFRDRVTGGFNLITSTFKFKTSSVTTPSATP